MSCSPSSPKRRRVLSSINPARPTSSRPRTREAVEPEPEPEPDRSSVAPTSPPTEPRRAEEHDENPLRPRLSRLKLKTSSRRHCSRSRHANRDDDLNEASSSHETGSRHRRHRHRHRHGRRHGSASRGDSPEIPAPPPLDPEAAFRESLFDAMADDEAASYWEHVYGQPIHVYPNQKVGPQGELERMTDDEYATYVRQKMFEKTRAGLLEEKAHREEQRKRGERERQDRRREEDELAHRRRKLQRDMEQSLRRGEARRLRKEWDGLWAEYAKGWATWDGHAAKLPWPVRGGRRRDVNDDDVRTFFVEGLNLEDIGERAFAAQLKEERVRWHPDKIQQRLGGVVDCEVMTDVTAIFQIIDRLWSQIR